MIPRKEHPNPQFERKNWINLNGEWEFEIDNGKSGRDRRMFENDSLNSKIIVPFCPESKLSGIENKDFMWAVWYRKKFELPNNWNNGKVFLHFGAVDYKTYLYINGKLVGTHKGGYISFKFDITLFLKAGENTIIVCAEDDSRSIYQPTGKQCGAYYSNSCHYTRTTGIWQTVWLESVPNNFIKSVKYYPDHINGAVTIKAEVIGKGIFKAVVKYNGKKMGEERINTFGMPIDIRIKLDEIHLWEAGNGRLYDVELSFADDIVKSYFGLRNVRLEGKKFLLNEKTVFQRFILDQGFYRDGIYTAPTDQDLMNDIKISQEMGFNGARLHQKIFEPRFLYYCDKMGYMIWGEHGDWGIDYSDGDTMFYYLPEWMEALERDFNHPAIIGWCPLNETSEHYGRKQNDDFHRTIYRLTKAFDNTRPCIDASGWYHVETDIFDVHNYDQEPKNFKDCFDKLMTEGTLHDQNANRQTYKGEPVFVSEYGGIKWNEDNAEGWGYGESPKSKEEFIERYKGLTDALLDNDEILGFCYTQLYDIEQEVNGLYTYDRVAKFNPDVIRAINLRKAKIEQN